MLQKQQEVFRFINSTIKDLEANGELKWASRLRDATLISFMPGELFREIRKVLKDFQKTKLPRR